MRDRAATTRIYGRNPVAEAKRGRRRVHRVWTAENVSREELDRLAGSPDHQGVVAEVDAYPYADPDELLAAGPRVLVALDEVQDPQNLGAVCRTAEFAGVAGVALPERRSAGVTAAVCKASAGAVEHLALARVRNLADWLGQAKDAGFWIYGAATEGGEDPASVEMGERVVLVVGGEGKGLRPRVAGACDAMLTLPRRGRVESLNVSAATAVLLFRAARPAA